MRFTIVVLLAGLSLPLSRAGGAEELAKVSVKESGGQIFETFTLVRDLENASYRLVHQERRKPAVSRDVPGRQAHFIQNYSTRIIWNSEFRRPAPAGACKEFVRLRSGNEETKICAENRKAAAMAFGLLHSLARLMKSPEAVSQRPKLP